MEHSNQIREFLISRQGIDLVDAYIGPGGMLVGAARATENARQKAAALAAQQETLRLRRTLERKHTAIERQIATLRSEYEAEEQEAQHADHQAATRTRVVSGDRSELALLRHADAEKAITTRRNSIARKRNQ